MKPIVVISLPEDYSDEALEAAFAAPFESGYYLASVLGPHNGSIRAVFKRLGKQTDPAEDEKAVALLKKYATLALAPTVGMLAANGIKRTQSWVSETRAEIAFRNGGGDAYL
jgi:hypothetical protein